MNQAMKVLVQVVRSHKGPKTFKKILNLKLYIKLGLKLKKVQLTVNIIYFKSSSHIIFVLILFHYHNLSENHNKVLVL